MPLIDWARTERKFQFLWTKKLNVELQKFKSHLIVTTIYTVQSMVPNVASVASKKTVFQVSAVTLAPVLG